MSVTILPMSQIYHWRDTIKGAVASSFNLGYMITNLYGGYLAAAFPAKHVLGWGVVCWSVFTLLTPLAAAVRWLPLLLACRAMMGLGEGVAFPVMQAIMKGWVPADKRSRALSLIYSGHQFGSIISLLVSPLIINGMGWPRVFYIYGTLGFLWLWVWDPLIGTVPPLLGPGSASAQQQGGSVGGAGKEPAPLLRLRDLPWRQFACSRPFWALVTAHSTFGIGYNLCISWLPTYYHQQFNVNVKESAWLSILPWMVMALGTNASGWLADALVNAKRLSTTRTRKLLQVIGSAGPAACLLYLAAGAKASEASEASGNGSSQSVAGALGTLTLCMGLLGFQAGGFASNHQDISSRLASVLFGITNAAASLAGMVFVYLVGVILDLTASWALVFRLVAAVNLASTAVFLTFATSEQQFD